MAEYRPNRLKRWYHQLRRQLASRWWSWWKTPVIGITGSYGKTSTTLAIAQVLRARFSVLTTDINLDTNFNLPITLLHTRPWTDWLVLEYGIDHVGEMAAHLKLVRPQIGVLTGITPVHAEAGLLGSLKTIKSEKRQLIDSLPAQGLAVVNWDDPYVRRMRLRPACKLVRYGRHKAADYRLLHAQVTLSGSVYRIQTPTDELTVSIGWIGQHFAQAVLAAVAVADHLQIDRADMIESLSELKPLAGRMSHQLLSDQMIDLLDDSKRANPASVLAGLATVNQLKVAGRKWVVLGEMGELGKYQQPEHAKLADWVAQFDQIDYWYLIGSAWQAGIDRLEPSVRDSGKVKLYPDVLAAGQELSARLKPQDLLYLKGSLLKHLERIKLLLTGTKVGCRTLSCPFYHACTKCDYLVKGYTGK